MAANFSDVLFTREDGSAMRFHLPPCEDKAKLKQLVEKGGGTLSSIASKDSIRLAVLGKASIVTEDHVHPKYILDCARDNKLLDITSYRIKKGTSWSGRSGNESNIAIEDSDSDMEPAKVIIRGQAKDRHGRAKYMLADDMKIINFMLEERRYLEQGGNMVWKDMQMLKITGHSWQSMKDRYRKKILPNIDTYNIPRHKKALLTGDAHTSPYKRIADVSSSVQASPKHQRTPERHTIRSTTSTPQSTQKPSSVIRSPGVSDISNSDPNVSQSAMQMTSETEEELDAMDVMLLQQARESAKKGNLTTLDKKILRQAKESARELNLIPKSPDASLMKHRRRSPRQLRSQTAHSKSVKSKIASKGKQPSKPEEPPQESSTQGTPTHGKRAGLPTESPAKDTSVSNRDSGKVLQVKLRRLKTPSYIIISESEDQSEGGASQSLLSTDEEQDRQTKSAEVSTHSSPKRQTRSWKKKGKIQPTAEKKSANGEPTPRKLTDGRVNPRKKANTQNRPQPGSNIKKKQYTTTSMEEADSDSDLPLMTKSDNKRKRRPSQPLKDFVCLDTQSSQESEDLLDLPDSQDDDNSDDQPEDVNINIHLKRSTIKSLQSVCQWLKITPENLLATMYAHNGSLRNAVQWILYGPESSAYETAWCQEDDNALQHGDATAYNRLEQKYGETGVQRRQEFHANFEVLP